MRYFDLVAIFMQNCDDKEHNQIENITQVYITRPTQGHKKTQQEAIRSFDLPKFRKCKYDLVSCSICLNKVAPHEFVRELPCQHSFHKRCIDTWIYTSAVEHEWVLCPLCRQKIDFIL
jgi:hypothetical protein